VDSPDGGQKPAAHGAAGKQAESAVGRPHQPPQNHASKAALSEGAAGQHKPGRKRRKRKRGRKVFARDGVSAPPAKAGEQTALTGKQPQAAAKPAPTAIKGSSVERGRVEPRAGQHQPPPAAPAAAQPDQFWPAHPASGKHPSQGGPKGQHHTPPTGSSQSWRAQSPLYAALDLGTNNCRLLVAAPTRPGQFRVVDAFSRIVRLGEGLTASGRLADAAMDRAVEALKVCAGKLNGRQVRGRRLIATEACRAAANGEEFLARVGAETGMQLEIIDRETEARLAVSGCSSLIEPDVKAVVLFDIGGGSSEIALIDLSAKRSPRLANHIVAWTSLPVGVVSLAERFGGRDVTPESYEAMVGDVTGMISRFEGRGKLGALASGAGFHLLGTSGTVTTLAGVSLGLEKYERRRVDGLWMTSGDVDAMSNMLLGWDFAARVANPCIGADRADLVLAGCAILEAIRRQWPSERLRVADRGLREGILAELMASDGAWRRGRRPWR
jgi:exopolyphosphatase/guanosine-5'-triphosphate,3'-diphosphate pyrophosphatase